MKQFLSKSQSILLYTRLLRYVRWYWWALALAFLGNITFSGVDAGMTYLLKPILNKGFIHRDIHFLHFLPFLVSGAFVLRGVANCVGAYFMAIVSRSVVMKFRSAIFDHLLYLPASFYDKTSSGQVLSTIIYNVEQVANAGADALTDLVQSGCLIIGLLVVMFSISWRLSLLYFVTIPFIALAVRWSTRRLRRISLSIQEKMGKLTSISEEAVVGYKVVRSFGGESYEAERFYKANRKNRQRELRVVLIKSLSVSGIQLMAGLVLSLVIYLAISHIAYAKITAGGVASIIAAMLALLKPLKTFTKVNATIQKGLAGAQSVFDLLDNELEQDTGTKMIKRVKGEVEFSNVSFQYPETSRLVLEQINFFVAPGQKVALVGHSGAGKTTIINLLQRFYDNYTGTIAIDGVSIREFKLADLRRQFATVSQDVTLFNDTIANNIAYGRLNISKESEIIQSAKVANAWDFIQEMPKGIHTEIGDNGVLLSGGQRQRLAIARAVLKDAPILILDEATSALDTESERKIQEATEHLMANRTTFIIAHRLSTVKRADIIMVLDHGKIVEMDRHDELLKKDEQYAKLYKMQAFSSK